MSGGDQQFILDELARIALHVGQQVADFDRWSGPFDTNLGINFIERSSQIGWPRWAADTAKVDVTLFHRPNSVTRRDPYPGETYLGGDIGVKIPTYSPEASAAVSTALLSASSVK